MQPPQMLVVRQGWFAKAIASDISTLVIDSDEAEIYLKKTPRINPLESLGIYQRSYWKRLIEALAKNFPTLAALPHFEAEIAIPYLKQSPPNHWSLLQLGNDLVAWLKNHPQPLQEAAALDWAALVASQSFVKEIDRTHLQPTSKLALQAHVSLLSFPTRLLVWQNRHQKVVQREVTEEEFEALQKVQNGISLQELVEIYGTKQTASLSVWLQAWASGRIVEVFL